METQYLKTLVVAAETGSFSRTATTLNVTQSAVSQRVKALEERYGHQLLDRSGPVMRLTDVGRFVVERAKVILEKEQQMVDELKNFNQKKRLSLCCTPTFGLSHLPGILNDFMLQHADVTDIKFMFQTTEEAVQGLHDNEFDIAIIEHCDDFDLSPFKTVELPRDELVFISSPDLGIAATDQPIPLDLLLPFRLYTRQAGCSGNSLLIMNLREAGRDIEEFQSVLVSDDLRLIIESVRNGGGVSFISRSLVSGLLQDGLLREHRVEGFRHHRSCTVVLPNRRRSSDYIGSLLDSFVDSVLTAVRQAHEPKIYNL